jgi:vacuolar-type H+-ATPase subunit C/Vma6
MAGMSSVTDIIRQAAGTPYQKVLAHVGQSSVSTLEISLVETSLNRFIATRCFTAFAGWRFYAGVVVAFLMLKLFETNDLKAILTGKAKSIPPSVIWKDLVLHSPPAVQK